MPHGLKVARLVEVEGPQVEGELPLSGAARSEVRRRSPATGAPPRKKAKKADSLAIKVGMLASEFSEIKGLLLNLQRGDIPQARAPTPQWDEDALSTRASCSQLQTQLDCTWFTIIS